MKIKGLNFSPGTDEGGAEEATSFDKLAEEMEASDNEDGKTTDDDEEEEEEKESSEGDSKDDGEKPAGDAVDKKKEKPAAAKKEDEAEEGEDELEAAEGDDKKEAGEEGVEEEDELPAVEVKTVGENDGDSTWAQVAEDLGIEAPEDPNDYDAVREGVKKKLASEYERGLSENPNLKKYSPSAQRIIKAINGGVKEADILRPLAKFDAALMKPAEDFMLAYYTDGLKYDETLAQETIETLKAAGSFDVEYKKTRLGFEALRDKELDRIIQQGVDEDKKLQDSIKAAKAQDTERVRAAVNKTAKFMDAKVSDQHRQQFMKEWENGDVQKMFQSDPDAVVEMWLFRKFGKARMDQLRERAEKGAKVGTFKKLANVPDTGQAGGKIGNTATGDSDDPFAGLAEEMDKGVDGVTFERS